MAPGSLAAETLAPVRLHLAAFALYEALVCIVVMRLLWYALRRMDAHFSVSLLLAMYVSGSIFSSAAIAFDGIWPASSRYACAAFDRRAAPLAKIPKNERHETEERRDRAGPAGAVIGQDRGRDGRA